MKNKILIIIGSCLLSGILLQGCAKAVEDSGTEVIATVEDELTEKSQEIAEPEVETEEKTEEEAEEKTEPSIFELWGYTGYLDECRNWTNYQEFVDCDYDEDGKIDRVYKHFVEGRDTCVYWIEFGNGTVLELNKVAWDTGFPHIQTADLQGDGEKEIIFTLSYDTSTGPMAFGDFAVFERTSEYSFKKLEMPKPFKESEHGYSQELPIHYEKEGEQSLRVSCEEIEADFVVPIDSERWNDLNYKEYAGETYLNPVWQVTVKQTEGKKDTLECGIALFDKWSSDEMIVTIGYDDGLVVEEVVLSTY